MMASMVTRSPTCPQRSVPPFLICWAAGVGAGAATVAAAGGAPAAGLGAAVGAGAEVGATGAAPGPHAARSAVAEADTSSPSAARRLTVTPVVDLALRTLMVPPRTHANHDLPRQLGSSHEFRSSDRFCRSDRLRLSSCPPVCKPDSGEIEKTGHGAGMWPTVGPGQRQRIAHAHAQAVDSERHNPVAVPPGDIFAGDTDGDAVSGQADQGRWIVGLEAHVGFETMRPEGAVDDQPRRLFGRGQDQALAGDVVEADAGLSRQR